MNAGSPQNDTTTPTDVTKPESTLADDLSAAWEATEAQTDEDTTNEETGATETAEREPVVETAEAAVPADADREPAQPDEPEKVTAAEPAVDDLEKPPVGLPPAAREAWKDTPQAVREALARRERDFANGIKQYAENAKRVEQMDRALAPFQQYFAMTGQPPAQTLTGLLQTASLLQMGSPAQRAQTAASLIQQFGVDIGMLDDILSGQQPRQEPQGNQTEQLVQKAIQPYVQTLQQFQQQQRLQQQQQEQAVQNDIQQFANDPANEFYADVRGDMADILEIAGRRGQALSLKDAYDRACAMNPEISRVLATRQAQSELGGKRRAASSVSGAPAGTPVRPPADSLRGAIEQAWDSVGRV